MPSPAVRRILAAIAVAIGLVLFVVGLVFAVRLGPQGTATFSARSSDPVVITPQTLNRVDAPVTVTATSTTGPVFVAAALPQDATDALGTGRHAEVVAAEFPGGGLDLSTSGSGTVPDITSYHVWRSDGQGSLTLTPDQGAQSVVVFPTKGGEVDVTVSISKRSWFLLALGALLLGIVLAAFGGYWLWSDWKRGSGTATPGAQVPDEPASELGEPEEPAEGEPVAESAEAPRPTATQEVRP